MTPVLNMVSFHETFNFNGYKWIIEIINDDKGLKMATMGRILFCELTSCRLDVLCQRKYDEFRLAFKSVSLTE